MHRVLARQLKKLKLEQKVPPDQEAWQSILEQVDSFYEAADQDRYTLERSLTISFEESKALHQKQKQSVENRMQSILDAMPDILFLLDEDTLCLDVMSGDTRSLENIKATGLGKYAHDVFPEKLSSYFHRIINQALDKGQLVVANYEIPVKNRKRYFEGRVMPTDYEADGKRTVVFIAIDITRRIESELQSELITTMFNNSKEGMLILDQDYKLVSVNHAFCDLMNVEDDAIDAALPGIIDTMLIDDEDRHLDDVLQNDGYWIGEITGYTNSGKSFPLLLTVNTVADKKGEATNYVIMLSDVSAVKQSQEQLEYIATHDALTNLPNRILFQDRLEQAISRSKRNSTIGALFFLDLDKFKNINDNLGHQIGDDLLIQVTVRLSKVCRDSDTLARIGGDEFTLIAEGLNNAEESVLIARKLLNAFSTPINLGGYNMDISTSIGISIFPLDSEDPIELVKQADTAMYSAKEQGRNTYQSYTQELASNAFEYFAIEIALKQAIQNDELFLLYQPQYDLETDDIVGVEALIRWQHHEMGLLSPALFIGIAEDNGQIEAIGEWVIRQACRQCREWDRQGLPEITVSVNISRKQLVITNLAENVKRILDQENITGDRLEFEITESSILENKDVVYSNLSLLHDMGVTMAIDDFGTGYSSLINLKEFPLEKLKIDQSFVCNLTEGSDDAAIIKATIAMGKSLGLTIIAEGVEEIAQRDFLSREGCDQMQGYLYSKPILADEITEMLLMQRKVAN